MIKITSPDIHPGLVNSGVALTSFINVDRPFKSASDMFMKSAIDQFRPPPGMWLQHLIAMGAHDSYGWNRNADSFTREELKKSHHTFVKDAHLYREHRNTCPTTLGIGQVKASAYNPKMDWVELLVWGDRAKAAKEYEDAKAGKELSYSMSCKIAGDVCSCCNHFSRRTTEYCKHAANHLNQYLEEFQKYAFVFNPNPRFFDISIVGRPADRIAHYLTYRFGDDMAKAAAADGMTIGGAEWSRFYGQVDDDSLAIWVERMHKDAAVMMESRPLTGILGFTTDAQLSNRQLAKIASVTPATVLRTMAKRAGIVPFESFVAWFTQQPIEVITKDASYRVALEELHDGKLKAACAALCSLENDLCGGKIEDGDVVDAVMDEMDGGLACKVEGKVRPVTQSCEMKIANTSARDWAALYGVYKAATLREMMDLGNCTAADATVVALRF